MICEEFKSAGDLGIHLERELMVRRVYSALDINRSGTRREEFLLEQSSMSKICMFREFTHKTDEIKETEFVLNKLKDTKNDNEFLDSVESGR